MTTAIELCEQAAKLAGVRPHGQALSAEDNTTCLGLLNQYLASLASEGVDYGLAELVNTDTVYIDDADLLAIRYNLGLLIAEDYGLPIDARIIQRAFDLDKTLRAKYLDVPEMELPAILQSDYSFNITSG